MFLVVSRRQDFSRQCASMLGRWGKSRHLDDIERLPEALAQGVPTLVVADAALAASLDAATVQQWVMKCGTSRLLLAATSMTPTDELAALAAGAVACCDADLPREDFQRVIGVVLHGGVWVSKATIPLLMTKLQNFAPSSPAPSPNGDGLDGLTERQREVALMVGRGANNKQIARALDISDRTVKAHLTSIFEKLGISDRLQLALHVNGSRHEDGR